MNRYYHTDWIAKDDIQLGLDGLNMDTLYDGFIKQIARDSLTISETESVSVAIHKAEEREKLQNKIAALEKKVYKEKQFNRQVKLNTELKVLRNKLEELENG